MSFGQGGGGWGQGGGGFGQPPGAPPGAPPGGGGGFGPPPGGGGGGFGPPGGFGQGGGFGHGGGGFGHGQPPGGPGGGEQPLARIPFSREDEANLMGAARVAKIAGVTSVVSALINTGAGMLNGGGSGFGGMLGIVIAAALAALLFRAAGALEKVATTDHADQHHLMAALRDLRTYFMVRGIAYIAVTLLICCCGALFFVFFGAMFGMLTNAR